MRAMIVAGVLALGFAIGFYVSRQGDEHPVAEVSRTVTFSTATVAQPPPTAPASKPQPAAPPAQRRPEFSIATLPQPLREQLKKRGFWHAGCPVALSGLSLLTVAYRGFDHQAHTGTLVVNGAAARPLERVFRRLYRVRYPIRHVGFAYFYGRRDEHPRDGDVTASFECRQSVPSPCTGGLKSGHWSMHAYGLAVDLNPTENPYVGCGQSRDPATKPYRDRSRHLRGMVDERVIAAFSSVGWGWGGSWAGSTKDYMHFSSTGH